MRARRVPHAVVALAAALASCAFDWDAYDPRLATPPVGAGGFAGAGGGAGGTTTTGGSAGSGGGGGSTMMPGEVVCHMFVQGGWVRDVAAYPDGGFVLGGDFWETISVGGDPLTSAGESDGLIARFGPACEHVFSVRTGSAEIYEGVEAIAIAPDGHVIAVGSFALTSDFGNLTETAAGGRDAFVAKLDPSGDFVWVRGYGGTGNDWGRTVTVDGTGNIYAAITFEGTVDAGGGPLASNGSGDVLVVKLDAAGAHEWSTSFGSSNWDHARDIAVSPTGMVVVVGQHDGAFSVGTTTVPHLGNRDGFVVALDGQGNLDWARGIGSATATAREYVRSVALRPNGNSLIVGRFDVTLDLGASMLASLGGREVFFAELDSQGQALWAQSLGGSGDDRACAIAVDADGNIGLAGSLEEPADLGGGTVGSAEDSLFAALYDPAGALVRARVFSVPGSSYSRGLGIAFAGDGDMLVSGHAGAAVDFGVPPTHPRNGGFVVRLAH